MDILGIGFAELIFIFLIAMMIFGPRRLPELAGKAGKFVADLRNMSQGLMAEWQREITVAARLEEIEKARQELKEIEQELKQIPKDVSAETAAAKAVVEETTTIAPPRATPKPAPAAKPAPAETSDEAQPPAEPLPPEQAQPVASNGSAETAAPASPPEHIPESRSENGVLKSSSAPREEVVASEPQTLPTESQPGETEPPVATPPQADDEDSSSVSPYSKPKEVVNE